MKTIMPMMITRTMTAIMMMLMTMMNARLSCVCLAFKNFPLIIRLAPNSYVCMVLGGDSVLLSFIQTILSSIYLSASVHLYFSVMFF